MRILLVRHGESEANVDTSRYHEKGDQHVGLTKAGWHQGIRVGEFLGEVYQPLKEWPVLYCSSFARARQTLSGILAGADSKVPGQPLLREDARLVEHHFGAYFEFKNLSEQEGEHPCLTELHERAVKAYSRDPFVTSYPMGDSTKDVCVALQSFIDGTFDRKAREGAEDFLIVTHGAVIRYLIGLWAHLPMTDIHELVKIPGNTDVIQIQGEYKGGWEISKIFDGEAGQRVHVSMTEDLKPFSIEDLPPVPEYIKKDPTFDVPDPS